MTDMASFREAVAAWAAGGSGAPARALAARLPVHTVVLLEGPSDAAAVGALARSPSQSASSGTLSRPVQLRRRRLARGTDT